MAPVLSLAYPRPSSDHLFFPVDKSRIKKLPQQFEYEVIDTDIFRIGDLMIDANKIDLQISSNADHDLSLNFQWPSALLSKGELVIQDSSGKALFRKNLPSRLMKIVKSKSTLKTGQSLRADIGTLKIQEFDPELLQKLRKMAFFKFCVHEKQERTQIYLCSKDLYFSDRRNPFKISFRNSFRSETIVDINGRMVGKQGVIYLQNSDEILSMRALLKSGVTLDIDTRMGPMDLRDVYETSNHQIVIEASGSEPADGAQVLKREGLVWSAPISTEVPSIFVTGEGGIPMRQEFKIEGAVRPETLQIDILNPLQRSTYSSQTEITLKVPSGYYLQSADTHSSVQRGPNDRWTWIVSDITLDDSSRRFLKVSKSAEDTNNFVAATDFFRSRRNEATVGLGYYPLEAELNYIFWIDPHWGWEAHYDNYIQKGVSEANFQYFETSALYRLNPQLASQGASSLLGLGLDDFSTGNFSMLALTLKGTWVSSPPIILEHYFDDTTLRLAAPILSLSSSNSTGLSFTLRMLLEKNISLGKMGVGIGYDNFTLTNGSSESDFRRILALFELGTLF
jgi:hypothetical protein